MRFAIALFIFLFIACQGESGSSPNNASAGTASRPSADTTISNDTLRLVFIGDIMGHGDQIKAAYDPVRKAYDYEPCFRYVRPLLERAHLAIGNLELTLNNKGNYTGYPRFRSPDTLALALKGAGFDILVTSNNHSNDGDLYGIRHTLDVLDSIGIVHTGTYRDSAEQRKTAPLIVRKTVGNTEFSFALLNYTYGTNGIPTPRPAFVSMLDSASILADLQRAKAQNPDGIIAFVHWGSEYQLNESQRQRDFVRFFREQGVHIVIGAHPHVVQPIKNDTLSIGAERRAGICAYSLGNFISNQNQKHTDVGLVFELDLVKSAGKLQVAQHRFIPVWRYIHHRSKAVADRVYTVIPAAALEKDTTNFLQLAKSDQTKMFAACEEIRKHLIKHGGIERKPTFEEIFPKSTANLDGKTR